MPVELRKRKAPAEPAPPPPAKKKSNPVKKLADKAKAAMIGKPEAGANGTSASGPPAVGSTIRLDGFGGEVQTHTGVKTTLAKLVEESKGGVVLFTYPKASTPGCTKQACMFRDGYASLTSTGFAIYGLSRDSPSANTNFVTKQSLPYPLLCDPAATLIGAIGLKKAPAGTTRGVFVVDKSGKVLASEPGSPDGTVAVVRRLVGSDGSAATPSAPVGETKASSATTGSALKPDEPKTKPLTPNPVAPAAKPAMGPGVPGDAFASRANDAAVAKTAADTADAAQKVDPVGAIPGSSGASVPGAPMSDPVKDAAMAKVASDVADTAQKIDPATPNPS